MTEFIFIYKGPATRMEDISEERSKEIMDAWKVWMKIWVPHCLMWGNR